jgi:SAM-dependent methyltransferase
MSDAHGAQLRAALDVHGRHRPSRSDARHGHWCAGRRFWRGYYSGEMIATLKAEWRGGRRPGRLVGLAIAAVRADPLRGMLKAGRAMRRKIRRRQEKRRPWPPRLGRVDLGDLASPRPVSDYFGFDRGQPVDRHYIERFLDRHRDAIEGTVLEIGDDSYSRRFGADRIAVQDVLHVHGGNPQATIIGDMSRPGVLPEGRFDAMIITQTLHLVFDFAQAIRHLHAALKPGGILLLTVPGITSIARDEWGKDWFWSFTEASLQRLFDPVFGEGNVAIEQFGNVYAATAFLHGLAYEELEADKLDDVFDPAYPVVLALRARRAA